MVRNGNQSNKVEWPRASLNTFETVMWINELAIMLVNHSSLYYRKFGEALASLRRSEGEDQLRTNRLHCGHFSITRIITRKRPTAVSV